MITFPELHTKRLKLRKIQVEDVPSLVRYANNKVISDNIVNIPYPYREPDAVFRISFVVQGFKKKERYVFAIEVKESREFIGEISLHFLDKKSHHAQLAYWLGEPFWNQGLMTEAIEAVIRFGFDKLHVDLIYADCHMENKASAKVLIKNRMTEHTRNGNLVLYMLEKGEYETEEGS